MNRAVAVVAAVVFLSPGSLYALYTVEDRGSWPELGFGPLDDSKAGVCIHPPPEAEAPLADAKQAGGDWRRTIYIELIVDGETVDLNRIRLPPNTPIIDERFQDGATQE